MNHDDRQLIAELFERMGQVRNLDKDPDAEAFIHRSMRENADSPYLLVQSVLAQEIALQEAGKRIEELEAQVARGESGGGTSAGPRQSSGFSGGAVPAGQPAPWEAPSSAAASSSKGAGAWGAPPSGAVASAVPQAGAARSSGIPATGRANGSGRASNEAPNAARNQARPSGGGFMAQAMTTAAGVAGGMLLANSIGSLFGGGNSTAEAATPTTAATDTASSPSDTQTAADQSTAADDQAGVQEASHDDWGDDAGWGDDDFGGGDFEL